MNREQKIWLVVVSVLFLGLMIFCFKSDKMLETMAESEGETIESAEVEKKLITDLDYNDTVAGAMEIVVDSVEEKDWGKYASYKNGELIIREGGSYCLSGRLEGTLIISVFDDEQVHVVLNGFEVYSSGVPALQVESAAKVIITAAEESQNIFCDSEYRSVEEKDSCIYSVADLTFNGSGNINIWGYYQDAVASKGQVKVLDGNYTIYTVDDGIKGRDGVVITGGTFALQTEGSAIKSTNVESVKKGDIHIQGGNLTIIAGEHAIEAAKNLKVVDCKIVASTVLESFVCNGELLLEEECVNEN